MSHQSQANFTKAWENAEQASQNNKLKDAARFYYLAVQAAPDPMLKEQANEGLCRALIKLAQSMMADGQWQQAQELYQRAQENSPKTATVRAALNEMEEKLAKHWKNYVPAQSGSAERTEGKYWQTLRNHDQACELAYWEKQIRESARQVQEKLFNKESVLAIKILAGISSELPDSNEYESLRMQVKQSMRQVKQSIKLDEIIKAAESYYQKRDFETVVEIIEETPQPDHKLKYYWEQSQSKVKILSDQLQPLQELITNSQWKEAWQGLERLRDKFEPRSPWWKTWQRIGMREGHQLIEKGLEAGQKQDFVFSHQCFQQAEEAFKKAKEFGALTEIVAYFQTRAGELAGVVHFQQEAQKDWLAGEHSLARKHLQDALSSLNDRPGPASPDYIEIKSHIQTMLGKLENEISQIEAGQKQLADGQKLLEAADLDKAKEIFERIEKSSFEKLTVLARKKLEMVKSQKERAEAALERGQNAHDLQKKIQAGEDAYRLWKTSPEVVKALQEALVAAGQKAEKENNRDEAKEKYNRAKNIPEGRGSQAAQNAEDSLKRFEAANNIETKLNEFQGRLNELENVEWQGNARSDKFQEIKISLEILREHIIDRPDQETALTKFERHVKNLADQWQNFEELKRKAEASCEAGEWDEAIKHLRQASKNAPGMVSASPEWNSLKANWENTYNEIKAAIKTIDRDLSEAQSEYKKNAHGPFSDYKKITDWLDEAQTALDSAALAVAKLGGKTPTQLESDQMLIKRLRILVNGVNKAKNAAEPLEAIQKLEDVLSQPDGQNDDTLKKLIAYYQQQRKNSLPKLREQADRAFEQDDIITGLKHLEEARSIAPEDKAIRDEITKWEQRGRVVQTLERARVDAQQKENPGDKLKSLRDGLAYLIKQVKSSSPMSASLKRMTELADSEDGLALSRPENWQKLTAWQSEFSNPDDWLDQQANSFVDQWAKVARDTALRGRITSAGEIKNYQDAYRTAMVFLNLHPQDKEAVEAVGNTGQTLINSTNGRATERLAWAQKVLEGERSFLDMTRLDQILSRLAEIEDQVYALVTKEFPPILEGVESVKSVREEAAQLADMAQKLKDVWPPAEEILKAARQACDAENLVQAEETLAEIDALSVSIRGIQFFDKNISDLHDKIGKQRLQQARRQLAEAMAEVEANTQKCTTPEQYDALLEKLEKKRLAIHFDVLASQDREAFSVRVREIKAQRDRVVEIPNLIRQAKVEAEAEEYEKAVKFLKQADEFCRDPEQKEIIRQAAEEYRQKGEGEKLCEKYLQEGQAFLKEGEFLDAATPLGKIMQLSLNSNIVKESYIVEAKLLLTVANHGFSLQQIQQAWGVIPWETGNATSKQDLLKKLVDVFQTNQTPIARKLYAQAKEKLDILDELFRQAEEWVASAEKAFDKNPPELDLAETKVNRVLRELISNYSPAVDLKERIHIKREGLKTSQQKEQQEESLQKLAQKIERAISGGELKDTLSKIEDFSQLNKDGIEQHLIAWQDKLESMVEESANNHQYASVIEKLNLLQKSTDSRDSLTSLAQKVLDLQSQVIQEWLKHIEEIDARLQTDQPLAQSSRQAKVEDSLQALEQIEQAASTAKLENIAIRAKRLKKKIIERQAQQGLTQAAEMAEKARSKADLTVANDYISEIEKWLKIFDKEYPELYHRVHDKKNDLQSKLDLYNSTWSVLENSKKQIGYRNFLKAAQELKHLEDERSQILETEYRSQKKLVDQLCQAEESEQEKPEKALKLYDDVIKMDHNLRGILRDRLSKCLQSIIEKIKRKLQENPPGLSDIFGIFESIEIFLQAIPTNEQGLEQWRAHLEGLKKIANALDRLEIKDLSGALEHLDQIQDNQLSHEEKLRVDNLKKLVQVGQDMTQGKVGPDLQSLNMLGNWVSRLPYAAELREQAIAQLENDISAYIKNYDLEKAKDSLKKAREMDHNNAYWEQRFQKLQEDLNGRSKTLQDANQALEQINTIFTGETQNWQKAIDKLKDLKISDLELTQHLGLDQLSADIQQELARQADEALKRIKYADAELLISLGLHLGPEPNLQQLRTKVLTEYQNSPEQVKNALREWQIKSAEEFLKAAQDFLEADHSEVDHEKLKELQTQISQQNQQLEELRSILKNARQAIQSRSYQAASQHYQEAAKIEHAPPLVQLWRSYSQEMAEAIKNIRNAYEKFESDKIETNDFKVPSISIKEAITKIPSSSGILHESFPSAEERTEIAEKTEQLAQSAQKISDYYQNYTDNLKKLAGLNKSLQARDYLKVAKDIDNSRTQLVEAYKLFLARSRVTSSESIEDK